ncbi:hypothetical protein DINM_004581 [Dirofilaria immitis]|nr:hypothetical protein [Dirofilaria immitis]
MFIDEVGCMQQDISPNYRLCDSNRISRLTRATSRKEKKITLRICNGDHWNDKCKRCSMVVARLEKLLDAGLFVGIDDEDKMDDCSSTIKLIAPTPSTVKMIQSLRDEATMLVLKLMALIQDSREQTFCCFRN